jgi:trehalose 6-phosphate phosphatase
MSSSGVQQGIVRHLRDGGHLTLFLDYDGTLVPIAPTPAEAMPDDELLELLASLASHRSIRTVILSGRPLDELQRLLAVHGLVFAGLYGVEMLMGGITVIREPAHKGNRSTLTRLRDGWVKLAGGLDGFLLEDKGKAVALHARWADAQQASDVLAAARALATDLIDIHSFRILDGDRYLEVAPLTANKGETVDWLLKQYPIPLDLPVGFGDDNKDDASFVAIRRLGGLAIGVGHRYPLPGVDARVESPKIVRAWLHSFVNTT